MTTSFLCASCGEPRYLQGSLCLLSMVLACVLSGCGGGASYELVPVSGRVTLDGQPLANARVSFQPARDQTDTGPGSSGVTDAEGKYVLSVAGETETAGAVPGKHMVTISANAGSEPASDAAPAADRSLPPQASDGSLTFDVSAEGTDQANFDLKKGGR